MLDKQKRMDGRGYQDLRPITCEVGVLPRAHGSAIFQRGETQALALVTLAPIEEAQNIDAYGGGEHSKSFLLHYNFPPFSVGETGRTGGASRREIGHGALAERSLEPVVPSEDEFPLRHPHHERDHGIERLHLDGERLRRHARADGCRRSDQDAGRRNFRRPRHRERATTGN